MKLFELQRDLADKNKEGRAIVQKAIDEKRDLTADDNTKLTEIRAAVQALTNKIALFTARDAFDADGAENRDGGRLGPDLPDLDGKHKYSLIRAMRMCLDSREGRGNFNGLEAEVHQTLSKNRSQDGLNPAQGILIPWQLANRSALPPGAERRDVTTSTASGGIANILGTSLIELLRNKMVLNLLGARVLSGLIGGTFSLPKQTSAATVYWNAEAAAAASSNLTLGQVTWTPRTASAVTVMTRKTLLQSSLDVEAIVRDDLMRVIAIELDRVGINGSGQDNQPLGILQDPNIAQVPIGTNGGSLTWAQVIALETAVAVANADFGALAYLTSNKGRGIMKSIPKVGTTFPFYIWETGKFPGEGEVNSYRALSTNQVPSNITKGSGTALTPLLFGNFQSATYGLWSGVDMLVDPYTAGAAGSVKVYIYQDCDFQSRWEQSFAVVPDMATS